MEALILGLRLINGLLTVSFLPLLLRIYNNNKKRFYLLWGLGFFLYGVHIIVRVFLPILNLEAVTNIKLLSYFIQLTGFGLILVGIGDLVDRTRQVLLSFIAVPVILLGLYLTTQPYLLGRIISVAPYLYIALALVIVKLLYDVAIEMLIIGWFTLLLANLGSALDLLTPTYLEVLAIDAKAVLLYGILTARFSYLVDDMKKFLISGYPTQYNEERRGRLILVNSLGTTKLDEISFMKNMEREGKLKGIRTILVSLYDVVSQRDMGVSDDDDDLYFVRGIQGGQLNVSFSHQHNMTIIDDPSAVGLLLMEVINFSKERKTSCQVILYTLSLMIHTHGIQRVYSMITSRLAELKNSNVNLYLIYNSKTHSKRSEIALLEVLADQVISIKGRRV